MDFWDSDKLTSKITEEQSKAWISEAFKARQEYKSGEISGDEMLERIRID